MTAQLPAIKTDCFTDQMNGTFGSGEIYYRWEHDPCRRQITAGLSVGVKEIRQTGARKQGSTD